ncbi:MAG: glycosyltransferase family 39 protein [bacterium]
MKTKAEAPDGDMRYLRVLRVAVFVWVALVCFYDLGKAPLSETDEGFAANRAASFYRHHTVILSYDDVDNDQPQFHKPPLVYWMVAGLYRALGFNMWAVRLPTAVSSFFVCLLLYLITRRHLGEWCALWSAILPCTVSILYVHMRTAMLDMPLICFTLLAVYLFAYAKPTRGMAAFAGCAAGAAIMTKGPAGALAILAAMAVRLVRGPVDRRLPAQCLLLVLATVAPAVAFYLAVPREFHEALLFGFFKDSGQQQVVKVAFSGRLVEVGRAAVQEFRWHVPAAALGLLVVLTRVRQRGEREWLALALLIAGLIVVTGAKLSVMYPRYLLPAHLFLLVLSAYFCRQVTTSRWIALLLAPFAAAALMMPEPGRLGWTPAISALIVMAGMQISLFRTRSLFTVPAALLLVVAVAFASHASSVSRLWQARAVAQYHPEVEVLARRAETLVPPEQKLIVGSGFKCHNALFHSRRTIESFHHWLFTLDQPGAVRFGLFKEDDFERNPYVSCTVVARTNSWRLVAMTLQVDPGIQCILIGGKRKLDLLRASMDLMGVRYTEFDRGLAVTNIPSCGEPQEGATFEVVRSERGHDGADSGIPDSIRLLGGDGVVYTLPGDAAVCGVDICPARRHDSLKGLRVEVFDPDTASWRKVKEAREEMNPSWTVEHGRLQMANEQAIRFRFNPIRTSHVRLTRTSDEPFDLSRAKLFVTDSAGNGKK